jgi:hypothetical protein
MKNSELLVYLVILSSIIGFFWGLIAVLVGGMQC